MIPLLTVAPLLGLIAMVMSLSHLLPLTISLALDDGADRQFMFSMAVNCAVGYLVWLTTRKFRRDLKPRDGIALVIFAWVGGAAFATIPLLLTLPGLSFTDAYFEAMAGLTASGGTVLSGLDTLPASINVWRAELQWLGGMGVLVLAVAILPLLNVGGRQVYLSEIPGPLKDARLTPRITETAKALWTLYAVYTLMCMIAYALAGMSWVDALIHAFSTMGLGGFSSHDASLGYYNSAAVETVAIIFMAIASINFSTHFRAWQMHSIAPYRRDPEAMTFVFVLVVSVAVVTVFLWANSYYPDLATTIRYAAFNTVSVATTTGYATDDYGLWPFFAPLWLLFVGSFATCSGSAGSGIKMIRAMILYRQMYREMVRMLHPSAIVPVKISGQVVPGRVIVAVLAFFFAWISTLVVATLALAGTGLDILTAFSAATASLCNIGPGLHQVGPASNFASLDNVQIWICTGLMLLGRLELFTVLVFFTPAFWRK